MPLVEKKVIVQLQNGLQARGAAHFVQKASNFESNITIVLKQRKFIAAKSIMGVMASAIKKGEEVMLVADGSNEQKSEAALEAFLLNQE
ncbi:HPr family phosphocarrier protein [Domibacillus sp. DTU_2020_1001157_1_SI_ALB_TIR_016]|uniref:HPr family phosphocarrier protein n=1 Tax=Domibacillus sp. DTU_2020_1001157_1_SI_ALB_TIR_016 TaxID=3077789 RepID=UPI003977E31E